MTRTGRRRPTIVTAACGMLAVGGILFAGEVLLSYAEYFTGMGTYEKATADGAVKNDGAFAGRPAAVLGSINSRTWRRWDDIADVFDRPADPDQAGDRYLLDDVTGQ